MVACDPVWLRRRPDQRQRSSLGKTLGLRMDGISVRKPFPLGSLVLDPRDQVTTQKRRHERGGHALIHIHWAMSVLCLHSATNNVSSPSPPLLCISRVTTMPQRNTSTSFSEQHLSLLQKPSPQKTLKLHHRGLTGNPDTTYCWANRGGLGGFATLSGSFFLLGLWCC